MLTEAAACGHILVHIRVGAQDVRGLTLFLHEIVMAAPYWPATANSLFPDYSYPAKSPAVRLTVLTLAKACSVATPCTTQNLEKSLRDECRRRVDEEGAADVTG